MSAPAPVTRMERSEANIAATIERAEAGIDEVNDAMLSAAAARLHGAAK